MVCSSRRSTARHPPFTNARLSSEDVCPGLPTSRATTCASLPSSSPRSRWICARWGCPTFTALSMSAAAHSWRSTPPAPSTGTVPDVGAMVAAVAAVSTAPLVAAVLVVGGAGIPPACRRTPSRRCGDRRRRGAGRRQCRRVSAAGAAGTDRSAAAATPRRASVLRLLAFVGVLAVFPKIPNGNDSGGWRGGLLAPVTASLRCGSPWDVDVLSRVVVHRSRSTASVLAGRRMRDDAR